METPNQPVREMSLEEYLKQLPESHRANVELKEILRDLNAVKASLHQKLEETQHPASAATAEKPHGPSMMGGFDMNTPEGRAGLKAAAAASEAKSGEMAFNYGVRKDGSIWAEYGTIDGERHCAGDMNWPLWAHADLKRRLDEQAHCAAATAKERQARQLAEGENARLREDGISRFPGFSLRESPIRVQRLGFAWLDQKGLHRRFEMAITDNHPLMVANQLKELAEGIEEAHWDPKSPLARLAPAPAGGKP